MSFNFVVNVWATVDENSSRIRAVTEDKISILYYFNDDLENTLSILNNFTFTYGLETSFHDGSSRPETSFHDDCLKF